MNISTVLVPVDFSPSSILAVNYAVALARKFRARLMLLHVLTTHSKQIEDEDVVSALSMLVSPEDQDDLNLVASVKRGDVQTQITAAVSERQADIVVMGTNGRRLLGRLLMGSVTEGLLRQMIVPVMTVSHAVRPLEFNRILFATDLSDQSKRALHEALEIAQRFDAAMTIVHVGPPLVANESYDPTAEAARTAYRETATAELENMVSLGLREKVQTKSVLLEGNVVDGILQTADNNLADLIILAVAERGLMDRVVFGSSAERIIREARLPVLSLHVPVMSVS